MPRAADTTARPMIVFSDLDGTLLDHQTYDFEPARPALDRLRACRIPLVLASSKTAAEIESLRRRIGFSHCPAIVENGAGILPSEGQGGAPSDDDYGRIRALIGSAPAALRAHFRGFADLGTSGVMAATGLSERAAQLAATRRFSEPGLWTGTDEALKQFTAWLTRNGLQARFGGRFLTLSFGDTKAGRMDAIAAALCPGEAPFMVALGDAPNDIEMLERADRGFIIANPHGKPVPELVGERAGRISRTTQTGPAGWSAALTSVLS